MQGACFIIQNIEVVQEEEKAAEEDVDAEEETKDAASAA